MELIIAMVLAGVLAVVAVPIYQWAFGDTETRMLKLDAQTFERFVRAEANSELRAPSPEDASTVSEQMKESDAALDISLVGDRYELTRGSHAYCVALGSDLNEPGTITKGTCS